MSVNGPGFGPITALGDGELSAQRGRSGQCSLSNQRMTIACHYLKSRWDWYANPFSMKSRVYHVVTEP